MSTQKGGGIFPDRMGSTVGGPHGVGDPDDLSLRVVERDVVIPKRMKEKANKVMCKDLVKVFTDCSKETGLLMPFKCRKEAHQMKVCLAKWFQDPAFYTECKDDYLKERSEYRRTGIPAKQARKEASTF